MDGIKEWIIMISVVSASCGIIFCLIPKSRLKKAYSTFIGVVIIYTVLLPVIKGDSISLDFDNIFGEYESISESFDENQNILTVESAQAGISKAVSDALNAQGIKYEKIETKCKLEDEEIIIESITVYGAAVKNQNRISERIYECIAGKTKINFVKGDINEQT